MSPRHTGLRAVVWTLSTAGSLKVGHCSGANLLNLAFGVKDYIFKSVSTCRQLKLKF